MFQLMVNWWFGARWFGILGVPSSNYPFHNSIIGIHRAPNHQFTTTTTRIYTYKFLELKWPECFAWNLLTLLKVVKTVPDLQLNIHQSLCLCRCTCRAWFPKWESYEVGAKRLQCASSFAMNLTSVLVGRYTPEDRRWQLKDFWNFHP